MLAGSCPPKAMRPCARPFLHPFAKKHQTWLKLPICLGALTLTVILYNATYLISSERVQLHDDGDCSSRLFQWASLKGAEISKVRCGFRPGQGAVRGLFATEAMTNGSIIARVPVNISLVMGTSTLFKGQIKQLLAHWQDPSSPLRVYLDSLPPLGTVVNGCTFPHEYLPMLESKFWRSFVLATHKVIEEVHQEEVANFPKVTLEELKHLGALIASRLFGIDQPPVMAMVPVLDLCNHQHWCGHEVRFSEDQRSVELVAGNDVKEGEEICYRYGTLEDDYAITHYGFLPAPRVPPALFQVDHRMFEPLNYTRKLPLEPFQGTGPELKQEVLRLQALLFHLNKSEQGWRQGPQRQDSPQYSQLYDLLKTYQKRRRTALSVELRRLELRLEELGQ